MYRRGQIKNRRGCLYRCMNYQTFFFFLFFIYFAMVILLLTLYYKNESGMESRRPFVYSANLKRKRGHRPKKAQRKENFVLINDDLSEEDQWKKQHVISVKTNDKNAAFLVGTETGRTVDSMAVSSQKVSGEKANRKTCPEIETDWKQFEIQLRNRNRLVNFKVFTYSAYLDDRLLNKTGNVHVRIFLLQAAFLHRYVSFSCHLQTEKSNFTSRGEFYKLTEHHGLPYAGFILNCKFPFEVVYLHPCSVSILVNLKNLMGFISITLPLNYIFPASLRYDFGMCLPALFGNINLRKIVEFFELSKLLGAQHFFIYDYTSSKDVHQVLKYYKDQGELTVLKWNFPFKELNRYVWYYGQSIAINNCIYRTMGKIQTVVLNDLDEFIIPEKVGTWKELLHSIAKHNASGYCFPMAFYDTDPHQHKQMTTSNNLTSQTYLNRTKIFCQKRRKCFVHPELVYEMGIHHISRNIELGHEKIAVEPSTAILHHYRQCVSAFRFSCPRDRIFDKTALRLGVQLKKNHAIVMQALGRN